MTELLKTLYWNLYIPYKNQEAEQELDDCHKQLIDVLGKPERKLVLRIIRWQRSAGRRNRTG